MLSHIALFTERLDETEDFYRSILGLRTIWKSKNDKVYLTSNGLDILGFVQGTIAESLIVPEAISVKNFIVESGRDIQTLGAPQNLRNPNKN